MKIIRGTTQIAYFYAALRTPTSPAPFTLRLRGIITRSGDLSFPDSEGIRTGLPCPLLKTSAKPMFAGILCAMTALLLIAHTSLPIAVMGGGAVYFLVMLIMK